jgi:hypothetical protein
MHRQNHDDFLSCFQRHFQFRKCSSKTSLKSNVLTLSAGNSKVAHEIRIIDTMSEFCTMTHLDNVPSHIALSVMRVFYQNQLRALEHTTILANYFWRDLLYYRN